MKLKDARRIALTLSETQYFEKLTEDLTKSGARLQICVIQKDRENDDETSGCTVEVDRTTASALLPKFKELILAEMKLLGAEIEDANG